MHFSNLPAYPHVSFSSVPQSCLTLCDPMNPSTPGLPVHHQLPEFTQIHVHGVRDVIISASHPLLLSSPVAFSLAQHQVRMFSRSVMSDSLRPHELQHARPPCPSPTPGVHWDSGPSSQWCHPAISSSVVLFSSCPQSLPASESFPMIPLLKENFQHLKLCLTRPLVCFLFRSSCKYRIWGFILYFSLT